MTAAEIARAHGCHPRTGGRWIDRVADIADPRDLGAAVIAEAYAPVLPTIAKEVARPGGAHAHKRLVRALAVLALVEALGSLRGLERPALAHAQELVATMPARQQKVDREQIGCTTQHPRSTSLPRSCGTAYRPSWPQRWSAYAKHSRSSHAIGSEHFRDERAHTVEERLGALNRVYKRWSRGRRHVDALFDEVKAVDALIRSAPSSPETPELQPTRPLSAVERGRALALILDFVERQIRHDVSGGGQSDDLRRSQGRGRGRATGRG